MQGPLQHIRSAALAAALLPLASVAAAPASAQSASCASGGICGYVWNDTNKNGLQDPGEPGIEGAVVSVDGGYEVTATDSSGFYYFMVFEGEHTIAVQIPPGTEVSPPNVGDDDTVDSDGIPDDMGNSVATMTSDGSPDPNTDFGFSVSAIVSPGTGTPGYWKNHPDAWPVSTLVVGGVSYTRDQAIALINQSGSDRRLTMFSSLVSAMLNVTIGNDASCVASTIDAANAWMQTYGQPGSRVQPASYAWKIGEPLHRLMDNYNNGMLCAPHRD